MRAFGPGSRGRKADPRPDLDDREDAAAHVRHPPDVGRGLRDPRHLADAEDLPHALDRQAELLAVDQEGDVGPLLDRLRGGRGPAGRPRPSPRRRGGRRCRRRGGPRGRRARDSGIRAHLESSLPAAALSSSRWASRSPTASRIMTTRPSPRSVAPEIPSGLPRDSSSGFTTIRSVSRGRSTRSAFCRPPPERIEA